MRRASCDESSPTKLEPALVGAPRRNSPQFVSASLTSAKTARSVSTPPPSPANSKPPQPNRSSSSLDRGAGSPTNGSSNGFGDDDGGGNDALAPFLLVGAAVARTAFQHLSPRPPSLASPRRQQSQQPASPSPQHMRYLEHLPHKSPRNLPPPILMSPRTPRDRPKTPRSVRFSDEPDIEVCVSSQPEVLCHWMISIWSCASCLPAVSYVQRAMPETRVVCTTFYVQSGAH